MAQGEEVRKAGFSGKIKSMFDSIAPTYDLLNRINSLGLDQSWRRDLVGIVANERPTKVLDMAAGTGDLSMMLAEKCTGAEIVACDLSMGMLEIGAEKALEANLYQIQFSIADAMNLPFGNDSFDAVTCAFGVRNFESIYLGYEEFYRVLRPGGIVAVLELCEPDNSLLKMGYDIHMRGIVPIISHVIGHNEDAYEYLADSISNVPQRGKMEGLMQMAGLINTFYKVYLPGVCALYVGYKPHNEDVYNNLLKVIQLQRR